MITLKAIAAPGGQRRTTHIRMHSGPEQLSSQARARSDVHSLVYRLDRKSSRLVAVDVSRAIQAGRFAMLPGNDGNDLVMYAKMPRTLEWVPVE